MANDPSQNFPKASAKSDKQADNFYRPMNCRMVKVHDALVQSCLLLHQYFHSIRLSSQDDKVLIIAQTVACEAQGHRQAWVWGSSLRPPPQTKPSPFNKLANNGTRSSQQGRGYTGSKKLSLRPTVL